MQQKENIIFALSNQGFRASKFIYEKNKNIFSETRSASKNTSVIISPKFIYGDSFCLLPPAPSLNSIKVELEVALLQLQKVSVHPVLLQTDSSYRGLREPHCGSVTYIYLY